MADVGALRQHRLLQRLRMEALPGRTVTIRQMPTLSPQGGLRMRVQPRDGRETLQ